jgi:hypothetical protein
MRRSVKRIADHNLLQEQLLLNQSVYEYYFHLESIKDSQKT